MDLDQLLNLTPPWILGAVLLMVGFFLKKSPVQNWLIPWLIGPLGAAVYPWIAVAGKEGKNPFLLDTLYGAGIGLAVVGGHQAFKQLIDFRVKTKMEGLPEGDTTLISKTKENDTQPP